MAAAHSGLYSTSTGPYTSPAKAGQFCTTNLCTHVRDRSVCCTLGQLLQAVMQGLCVTFRMFNQMHPVAHTPAVCRFHVDDMSSAHVYLRLPPGATFDEIPADTLDDCAQLVKANSIQGEESMLWIMGQSW